MSSPGGIRLKRAYEEPAEDDGLRILVERLWPRGVTKERAKIDLWLKDLAPSSELRKWYGHDPEKWSEFKKRYRAELAEKREQVDELRQRAAQELVTFVFAAKDEERNSAVVLKEVVESMTGV